MSVAVVIPARMASSRVPGKPLLDLGGRPVIEHVWRAAVAADVGPVFVATPDAEIADAVVSFGGNVRTTASAANGTRRVAQVAATLDADVLLNVQGDQPGLDPDHVRSLAALMAEATLGTLATPLEPRDRDDPAVVKVCIEDGWAVDFRRSVESGTPYRHLGLYGYTREVLMRVTAGPVGARARAEGLEQLTWLEGGSSIRVAIVDAAAPAIDTWAQLEAWRATSGG